MKRIIIAPYKLGSEGARNLARGIGAIRSDASKRFKRDVVLVNWGRSDLIVRGRPAKVLNPADKIIQATNKLYCLDKLFEANVSCVPHTTNVEIVKWWLREGHVVYGRKLLNASQGAGIIIINDVNNIPHCPLYTKGIIKSHEYRVHVFKDKILDVTKKRRRSSIETNDYVKNLANGWVYCRDGIDIPDNLLACAKSAVNALELDFGAVDILYKKNVPYVLEVNTAPGLQGSTLNKYIEEFKKLRFV